MKHSDNHSSTYLFRNMVALIIISCFMVSMVRAAEVKHDENIQRPELRFLPTDGTKYKVRSVLSGICSGNMKGTEKTVYLDPTRGDVDENGKRTGRSSDAIDSKIWITPSRFAYGGIRIRMSGDFSIETYIPDQELEKELELNEGYTFKISESSRRFNKSGELSFEIKKADDGNIYLVGSVLHVQTPKEHDWHIMRQEYEVGFTCKYQEPTNKEITLLKETPDRDSSYIPMVGEFDLAERITEVKNGKAQGTYGYFDIDKDGMYTHLQIANLPQNDLEQDAQQLYEQYKISRDGKFHIDPNKLKGKSKEFFDLLEKEGLRPILGVGVNFKRRLTASGRELLIEREKHYRDLTDSERNGLYEQTFEPYLALYVETEKQRKFAKELSELRKKYPKGTKIQYKNQVYNWDGKNLLFRPKFDPEISISGESQVIANTIREAIILKEGTPVSE